MRSTLVAVALASSLGFFSPSDLLDTFWPRLDIFWHAKEGCGADPNGRCVPAPQPQQKEGCGMDPSGRCVPKAGCGADPNGQPRCS